MSDLKYLFRGKLGVLTALALTSWAIVWCWVTMFYRDVF
jgi:hypothetical protein